MSGPSFAQHEILAAAYQVGPTPAKHHGETYHVWPFEQRRIAYLRRLGCHDPLNHAWEPPTAAQDVQDLVEQAKAELGRYGTPTSGRLGKLRKLMKHSSMCPLRRNIPAYVQEVERQHAEAKIIDVLLGDKLPKELVLRILAQVAIDTMPELTLSNTEILPSAAHHMLGEVPDSLLQLMQDVILETIPICLPIEMVSDWPGRPKTQAEWADPSNVPVAVSAFTKPYQAKVRTLVVRSELHPHHTVVGLPMLTLVQVFLNADLPKLQEFRLGFQVNGTVRDRRRAMSMPYDDTLTYRTAMEEVVAAIQAAKPGKRRLLQFHFSCERPCKGSNAILINDRAAAEIVEKAMEKLVTNVKKRRERQ